MKRLSAVIHVGVVLLTLAACAGSPTSTPRPTPGPFLGKYEALPARLSVVIEPEDALGEGAAWRLDSGDWLQSGQLIENAAPGLHSVELKALPGWNEAEMVSITLGAGSETTLSLAYRGLPRYRLGDIPPQTVSFGDSLEFLVDGQGVAYSVNGNPTPMGAIEFDASTGSFTYTPFESDSYQFEVTFQSTTGEAQTVQIVPLPRLAPEQSIFRHVGQLSDRSSRDFITVLTSTSPSPGELFNHAMRLTREVTIIGMTLVFEEGSQENDLYTLFGNVEDVRQMNLYADTVVVRSTLSWPQTHVVIHARELRFEDPEGSAEGTARIITTPSPFPFAAAQFADGENGLAGGNVELYLGSISAPASPLGRLIMLGGEGQEGGAGQKGTDGRSVPVVFRVREGESVDCGTFSYTHGCGSGFHRGPLAVTWVKYMHSWICYYDDDGHEVEEGDVETYTAEGINLWPGDGEPGISPGKAGVGGSGGQLVSTIELESLADLRGGASGKNAPRAPGGAAGQPIEAAHLGINWPDDDYLTGHICAIHYSYPGEAARPPDPDKPYGDDGSFTLANSEWIHPLLLDGVLGYAREAYLQGHLEEAAEVADLYLAIIEMQKDYVEEDLVPGVELAQSELKRWRNQISANRDYFGNPAGWVPMLSFESNLIMFENELEEAIPTLYMTYWLRKETEETQASVDSMIAARERIRSEIPELQTRFQELQNEIPGLKAEIQSLQSSISFLQGRIETREQELIAKAEQTVEDRHNLPGWKKALRVIGAALKVVPVYQPALAGVGSGLELVTKVDPNEPLSSLWAQRDVLTEFDVDSYEKKAKEFQTAFGSVHLDDFRFKDEFNALRVAGQQLFPAFDEISQILQDDGAPQSEVEAELERLKATDPQFSEFVTEVEGLSIRLQGVGERIVSLTGEMQEVATALENDMLAYDGIQNSLVNNLQRLDPRTLSYLDAIERRTMDRLLQYQYLVMKAYEYRMVEPYDGELNLNRLFEQFQYLANTGIEPASPEFENQFSSLRQIYVDELRRITERIFIRLNTNAPERSAPVSFGLTADELLLLNNRGWVEIDLSSRNLFGNTEENLRIVDLKTENLQVHPVGGPYGTTATLRLRFEHSGRSLLYSRGETFSFNNYATSQVNPITWKSVYDGISGRLTESGLSKASRSLLEMLLSVSGRDTSNLVLYSAPSALSRIIIYKQVSTDNNVDMVVDNLRLTITYDYYETRNDLCRLDVEISQPIWPIIFINGRDVNGRGNGQGAISRTYYRNQSVILRAEAVYGEWEFVRWADRNGSNLGDPASWPQLELECTRNVLVRAVYVRR